MKDLFALLMISVIISFVACGQKLKASKVPAIVKESFAKQFPGATAKWEKEDGKFEAGFTFQNNSCLLYTSPSPRDRTRSRMPSSA